MRVCAIVTGLALMAGGAVAQTPAPRPKFEAFEVATVKPPNADEQGRYIKMDGANRFVMVNYPVKLMIAAAYDLNPKTISGGPGWMSSDIFDITARTPGELRPTHDEQMRMLRDLLVERFGLKFHREQKDFSIYAVTLAKGGAKLKATVTPEAPAIVGPGVVSPQSITLPGRNATVDDLAKLLQRAILDRPVVDQTGLTGHYDFDLTWAPDETQFGGDVPRAANDAPALPLFEAIQQQLGLKLEATHGAVAAMMVDSLTRPSEN